MSTDFANIHADGLTPEGTYAPDRLFDRDVISRKISLLRGSGSLARGAVLGRITLGTVSTAAKAGGNTGNGTIGTVTPTGLAIPGVYQVRMTSATAFTVTDPLGRVSSQGATGVAHAGPQIGFTITAGGTAFVAGDGFDVTIAAGSGFYRLCAAANTDGSQVPDVILLEPVTLVANAEVEAIAAISGRFNQGALAFGAGHTAASVSEVLRDKNIHLETIVG